MKAYIGFQDKKARLQREKMKKILITLAILVVGFQLFAENGWVSYIDGYADIQDGSDWTWLDIGDDIPGTAVIKLDSDSFIEIEFQSTTLKLFQEGIYNVADLLSDTNSFDKSGMGTKTVGVLTKLLQGGGEDLSQSQVGGARAAEVTTETDLFGSGYAEQLLSEGRDAYDAEDYDTAYSSFYDAYDFAENDEQETEALYYLALISYETGKLPEALDFIDEVWLDDYSDYYPAVVFLKGQILIEGYAYQKAIDWLAENPGEQDDPAYQGTLLLLGIANLKAGNDINGAEILQQCVAINPSSDIAKTADYFIN